MTELEVSRIVGELTLEEKASLVLGSDFWHTALVERLGVPAVMVSDGPHGLRKQPDEADHAGLSGSNPATCFPTACALASSWNTDLVRRVGEALGRETRAEQVAVLLGPGTARPAAPASASRSSSTWPPRTAARSGSGPWRARARRSPSRSR